MTSLCVGQRVRVKPSDDIDPYWYNRDIVIEQSPLDEYEFMGRFTDTNEVLFFDSYELTPIDTIENAVCSLSESDTNDIRRAMCLAIQYTNDIEFSARLAEISSRLPFTQTVKSEVTE